MGWQAIKTAKNYFIFQNSVHNMAGLYFVVFDKACDMYVISVVTDKRPPTLGKLCK